MKRTKALASVAAAFLEDPDGRHWGYALSKASGVASGVLYPMLTRFLNEGLVTDGWEDPTTIIERRPPRRYYELTDKGRLELAAAAHVVESSTQARGARLGWANG
ncbi:PadR family transcriptional regulator [Amycolatopsis thailandensis]|uniref:PadR family transcriptional regulator n=1 Tax=Amycolatopsis thailandensis TaxID=589330 RepID=UPI003642491A